MMINLLQETERAIASSGHTPADIVFIGSEASGHQCSWDEFCALANREYDNDYGSAKVSSDLRIVFADGNKMWRGEYNGSEWWEWSTTFKQPAERKCIRTLFGGYTLEFDNKDAAQ